MTPCPFQVEKPRSTGWRNVMAIRAVLAAAQISVMAAEPVPVAKVNPPETSANHGESVFQKGDYAAAEPLLREAAEQGNARAEALLGYLYLRGVVVKQDQPEARKLFSKSAEQGDGLGQFL